MNGIEYNILKSIADISPTEWDSVFGDIPEGYKFYKTLEESRLEQFSFLYIIIRKNGKTILIAPVFTADFNLDIAVEGALGDIIRYIRKAVPRFLVVKTLFAGSPFGENGVIGISKDCDDAPGAISELASVIINHASSNKIPFIIFKDMPDKDTRHLDTLKNSGFLKVTSLPSVVMGTDFRSMDDYFKSLSHSRRKDIRRKIKKAHAEGRIELKITDDVSGIIDDIHSLYMNTYSAGKTKFEKLTREFFLNAAANMKPHAKFFLYYINGRLAAFNLCLVYKDLFIDKFIGFDYDVSYKYNLYFLSWCSNVEWCIKNGMKRFQTGQTDYHPKLSLGGRHVPLHAYIRHTNPAMDVFLKLMARFLRS